MDNLRLPVLAIEADYWSLRFVEETCQSYAVRKNIPQPLSVITDRGVMASVYADGGYGYAASPDTSEAGLRNVLERAARWARASARYALDDSRTLPRPAPRGDYASPSIDAPLPSRREWYELLRHESEAAGCDPRIVDWEALVDVRNATHRLVTSAGGDVVQRYRFLLPSVSVTAHADGVTQQRSLNGYRGICQQGGVEILARFGFAGAGRRVAEEALELLAAPNCPSERMDVLLAPDQMVLQIHESIGHPLELDRILGDERNYAGTSFVTPAMFGSYRYGSPLLNVTFDPGVDGEFAAYAVDDEGSPAERAFLIKDGVLLRGLGGATSQRRSGLPGVATARACAWNRPAIDRMANLNLEPGEASLEQLIGGVERGILMESNRSWSIDDSRNKFQFGVEYARLIVDGRLAGVVKNANYRGVSATFWRSLTGVGSAMHVAGTPNCGKGEPNQVIHVGHATPACRFAAIDVFGGG